MSTNARSSNEVGCSNVCRLNVFAQPYIPLSLQQGTRIQKSLFVTFSTGFPISSGEIYEHFTQAYGNCIEFVYIHREEGKVPEFGRIMFVSADLAAKILGNRSVVKMFIRGKPMWLKKYVSRHRN
ncbi:uncharacterized protein [Primulina huaijiensis]|uniref:uncharacterized protein n=1 Tax=Primulina huaijiensis TaxID=1492673 RepID=UPI003CC7102D